METERRMGTIDSCSVSVTELFLYPIKSARGVAVSSLVFDARGPVGDRRWMLVDREAEFLSQRRLPRMSLLRVTLEPDLLRVNAPGMPTLAVPRDAERMPAGAQGSRAAQVWHDTVTVHYAGDEYDRWFREFLGEDCSLVAMASDAVRPVDLDYAPAGRTVSLADAFPLLVIGAASLAELNRRLVAKGQAAVPIDRFRPNLVVSGATPHAEDTWRRLEGPAITFDIVKPCARCAIVSVEQETGTRVKEPLATLEEYRRQGSKIMFGQNALHDRPGQIACGDRMTPALRGGESRNTESRR
jgi:hypothetical protein